jgi:hypothetical protein
MAFFKEKSRDNAIVRATGYRLNNEGIGVSVAAGSRFFFLQAVQTGPGAHSSSQPTASETLFPGVK